MIFADLSQKRWYRARLVFGLTVFCAIILLGAVITGLVMNPPLPFWQAGKANQLKAQKVSKKILQQEIFEPKGGLFKRNKNKNNLKNQVATNNQVSNNFLSTAFLEQDDQSSLDSFTRNQNTINMVFPDWYVLKSNDCQVLDQEKLEVTKVIKQNPNIKIVPRVTNSYQGTWYGPATSQLLKNEKTSDCLVKQLTNLAKSSNVAGLNIDFEDLAPEDKENFLDFLNNLSQALKVDNKLLTIDVTINDPAYDLEYIGKVADLIVVMDYDEHYPGGTAGPIASRDWFNGVVDQAIASVPKNKLLIGLGIYGYDWNMTTKKPAVGLKFSEIMNLAKEAEVDLELKPEYGYNFHFAYQDENKQDHQVWFLNGLTAWNQFVYSRDSDVAGVALWRLGSEDPTYWQVFKSNVTANDFTTVAALDNIDYLSTGELFKITNFPQEGKMQITTDTDGSIDYAIYQKLPAGYTLQIAGSPFPDHSLVLTFDDGPDNIWTPQIIKILKDNNVPATFFVVGQQVQENPNVLKLLASGNFLIGNHTYLHPDLTKISGERLRLEVNETNMTIAAQLKKQTILFRPPYNTDSTPSTPAELSRLAVIDRLNYLISGANIDAEDWQKPGVDNIIKNVLAQVNNKNNHVIVMHDGGGDRAQTVAALKQLIPLLKARGYNFINLDQASGISSKILNPSLGKSELILVSLNQLWLFLTRWFWLIIVWLFFLTTLIAIARILFLGSLVLRSARRKNKIDEDKKIDFPVSIIIPAFNEEKVIAKTISALQKSSYTNWEGLVVNDGSTDQTAKIVEDMIISEPRLKLINKINSGKSGALNLGIELARHEIVVTIDADTIFKPETLQELIRPLFDPKVDAVCGNVEVGNIKNILTGSQAIEYITTQNFDRRAFDELNCITVVPGATGAWRKSAVLAVDGYSDDTLTEDADLTLRLLANGARIVYASEARSQTEAPETISALAKQRFRWSFGTFQCLWKNRRLFWHGNLGRVGLPNMVFFQIIFPLLSPIGDLVFLLSILRGDWSAILIGYLLFTFMDICGSLLAFVLEKRSKKLMWLILIQRFFYRQFMYYVTYKSIIAIIRGRHHGWNKLQRTGNVVVNKS